MGRSKFLAGRFGEGLESSDRSIASLQESTPGSVHEIVTMQVCSINCLAELGRFAELQRRQQHALIDALVRGDLYARVGFTTGMGVLGWLVQDQPGEAAGHINAAMRFWPTDALHLEHLYATSSEFLLALYVNDANAAMEHATRYSRDARRTTFHRMERIRIAMYYYAGAAPLVVASQHARDWAKLRRLALKASAALARETSEWSLGFLKQLDGGIALHDGDLHGARKHLAASVAAFERWSMAGYALATSERLGRLQDHKTRVETRAAVLRYFEAEHVVSADRMISMLAPGLLGAPR